MDQRLPEAALAAAPTPPTEGEVAALVAALRADAECVAVKQPDLMQLTDKQLTRAADLLAQRHPVPVAVVVPVAVSERPWERPGWCDERGRCWAWAHEVNCWQLMDPIICADLVLLLPAHALPLPAGEVE